MRLGDTSFSEKVKNDVNNQQDAITFLFITVFSSVLKVSGDKFAHPQEQFLTVYIKLLVHYCRPVARLRWNVSSISTMGPVGSSVGVLYQKLYIQSKSTSEDGRICRPKHVGLN